MHRGQLVSSPYKLIVVNFSRSISNQVVVHREREWTDIRTAMNRQSAIVACIGSFRDAHFRPLGDLVINGVAEKTYLPHFRYFFSVLKYGKGFRLGKMTSTRRIVAGLNRNKPFSTYGIPEKELTYAKYAMGGVFGLIWRGRPLPYLRGDNSMGSSSPDYKKGQLEIGYWRAAYGFSKDSSKFFIVVNDESSPSTWTIETARDFFIRELPSIYVPAPESGNYNAYGAFLTDFGTGTHLFIRRGGLLIKANPKAGSLTLDPRGYSRAGNLVWIMVK